MIGQRLSHFSITAKLGEGGMGAVYLAEDTKLGREVAIKVLPEALVADAERLARFEREARVLASLDHANIAAIYEVGEAPSENGPSVHFLVMQLAPGESLEQRLARGPIPVEEAATIARQIASALETAHERGIVHRDLKPANVQVDGDGQVKVLDFGLAKAFEGEPGEASSPQLSHSPTLTQGATMAGVILGTAGYMSPEQAKGLAVDKRADIWSFGVVLWEMLTGRRLFEGNSVSETLAAVLRDPIPLDELPESVPPRLHRLLARCLDRDPRHRLRDIGEARILLEDGIEDEWQGAVPPAAPEAPSGSRVLPWAITAVAVVVALVALYFASLGSEAEPPTRFQVHLEEGQELSLVDEPILAISRDGRSLAFVAADPATGQDVIYLRSFDRFEPRILPGTEGGTGPFFSPDGRWLGFFSRRALRKVALDDSGALFELAEAPNPRGGVWGEDGSIYFAPAYDSGIFRLPAAGGGPEPVVEPDRERNERTYRWPDLSPDGDLLVYTVGGFGTPNEYEDAEIHGYSLRRGDNGVLVRGASMARFADDDLLVTAREGVLFAVLLDRKALASRDDPAPVREGVSVRRASGAAHFALSRNGTLAAISGGSTVADSSLVLVARDGTANRLPMPPQGYRYPRFSPDGKRIALTIGERGLVGDIWLHEIGTESLQRLTFDGNGRYPVWDRSGARVAYQHLPYSLVAIDADGGGNEQLLVEFGREPLIPADWSPDGRTLAYTEVAGGGRLFLKPLDGEPRLFELDASMPTFSPDGRWIAYQTPSAGNARVFVRPVEGEGKWQVSPTVGSYPRWAKGGRELLFIQADLPTRPILAVDVEAGETFRFGAPRVVLPEQGLLYSTETSPFLNWDVAPDGERFVFVEPVRGATERLEIEVVMGWRSELDATNR